MRKPFRVELSNGAVISYNPADVDDKLRAVPQKPWTFRAGLVLAHLLLFAAVFPPLLLWFLLGYLVKGLVGFIVRRKG